MRIQSVHKEVMKVSCDSCLVRVGEPCKTKSGGRAAFPHTSRIRAATEVKKTKRPNIVEDTKPLESFGDYFAEVVGAPVVTPPEDRAQPATSF